jgi:uncharacterized membrane protein
MVVLSVLIWLPRWAIASLALLMIAGHNLLDSVGAEDLGNAFWAWHVLHEPGLVPLGDSITLYILYPLIPWIGVMASGYLLGPVMQLDKDKRQRILFGVGAAMTVGFLALRLINLYGDPAPWTPQETWVSTSSPSVSSWPPSTCQPNIS